MTERRINLVYVSEQILWYIWFSALTYLASKGKWDVFLESHVEWNRRVAGEGIKYELGLRSE